MLDASLIHHKEKRLKPLVYGVSAVVWLMVLLSMVGAIYGLMLVPFILMSHAYFLGHLRGRGVRVDERQLPELYGRVVAASQKLKLAGVPEVYVIQSGGILNAFATQLFSRRYVVLHSDLIDTCHSEQEVDFIIAHELAHHAAGHLKTQFFTAPVRLLPLLGPAWSRACEYTCDRAALFAVGALDPSQRALAVLAAGNKMSAALDLTTFAHQQANSAEFWPAVAELSSSHPLLSKRVAMLATWDAVQTRTSVMAFEAPPRPALSYVVSIFFGQQALTLLVVFYLGFLMAAVAPNFLKLQERAAQAQGGQGQPTK